METRYFILETGRGTSVETGGLEDVFTSDNLVLL